MGKEEYNHYVAVLHFKVVPFMQSIGVVHRLRASVLCITQMFSKFRQPNDLTYRLGKIRSQSESRYLKKKKEKQQQKQNIWSCRHHKGERFERDTLWTSSYGHLSQAPLLRQKSRVILHWKVLNLESLDGMRFPTSWDRVSVLQCLSLSCQNVFLFHRRKKFVKNVQMIANHVSLQC